MAHRSLLSLTRNLELEIEAEKRELQRQAIEKSKDENKRAAAYQQAFQAARAGKASTVISLVEEYGLDVNSPEKMARATSKKSTNFQTLLHAACRSCDEGLILFLLDKGAISWFIFLFKSLILVMQVQFLTLSTTQSCTLSMSRLLAAMWPP